MWTRCGRRRQMLGATLVAANFPRVYIDPNRTLRDLDPELLAEPWPAAGAR